MADSRSLGLIGMSNTHKLSNRSMEQMILIPFRVAQVQIQQVDQIRLLDALDPSLAVAHSANSHMAPLALFSRPP